MKEDELWESGMMQNKNMPDKMLVVHFNFRIGRKILSESLDLNLWNKDWQTSSCLTGLMKVKTKGGVNSYIVYVVLFFFFF